jgi:hypothetical protein
MVTVMMQIPTITEEKKQKSIVVSFMSQQQLFLMFG